MKATELRMYKVEVKFTIYSVIQGEEDIRKLMDHKAKPN